MEHNSLRKSISSSDKKRQMSANKISFENDDASYEFSDRPIDLLTTSFANEKEICVKSTSINIKVVLDSYMKCIGRRWPLNAPPLARPSPRLIIYYGSISDLLVSHQENDLAVQAMHELGDLFYDQKDLK